MSQIAILGAGSWGTAIAIHLARNGHSVNLWDRNAAKLRAMAESRRNPRYLSEHILPTGIHIFHSFEEAIHSCRDIFIAVPSHGFADCLQAIKPKLTSDSRISWGSKGLADGKLLHTVAQGILGKSIALAVLSGPSFATEVAKGLPTAIVVASTDPVVAAELCDIFHSTTFRPYSSDDIIGVEIGGVVKNVLAIAIGVSDGLGYGANARSALITRGLAEMVRLGMQLGGKAQTFYGLAGVGDLILTATDNQSRNRRFGLALGGGASIETAKEQIGQVVEGARNAKEIYDLSLQINVDMPICEQVYALLYNNLPAQDAVNNLLTRDIKAE